MKKQPKVSIIVPVYNVQKYLNECLDSIINQTLEDIEIIVVNDGSKDASLKIMESYAKKDKRIVVVDKSNAGYGHTINRGIELAKGEYIGIVESDDWIEKDMYEFLYNLAKEHDVDVVKSNFYYYWAQPQPHGFKMNILPENCLNKVINSQVNTQVFSSMPCIWSAIYRKDFLIKNAITLLETPGASFQDTSFNFKVWSLAKNVWLSDKAFVHYRQDNEQSSINNKGKIFCIKEEFDEIEKFVQDKKLYNLVNVLWSVKFDCYLWNLKRIALDYKKEFFSVFTSQFKEAVRKKLFNKKDIGKNWKKINLLVSDSKKFYERYSGIYSYEYGVKLFSFLPLYKKQQFGGKKIYSFLGVPLYKIREMRNGSVKKYYFLGLPMVKISEKRF